MLGCRKLGFTEAGPVWIWILWFHFKGGRQYRSKEGLICWHILRRFLGPVSVQSCSASMQVTPAQLPEALAGKNLQYVLVLGV